ncbi:unnamed protein product [Moneuplotes crassus]|uniref:Uncharacterized protein n=1 Tax=Euplotes crassus TaxID=5936 RepID=A0AAD2CYR3_EUPCR|nr:unnamed protein product [Moneuplotes crassus]
MELANQSSKRIIYIRHALCEANVDKRKCRGEESKDPKKLKSIKADPTYIDSPLHPDGYPQIEKLADRLSTENINVVMVSPLRRTMSTCMELMKSHPNFEHIKFVISPFIISQCEGFMDVPSASLEEIQKEYEEKYQVEISVADSELQTFRDWSKEIKSLNLSKKKPKDMEFLEALTEVFNSPKNYYLHLFSQKMQKDVLMHLKANPEDSLINFLSKKFTKSSYEKSNNVKSRLEKFKEQVCNIISDLSEEQQVLVVSHSNIICLLHKYKEEGESDKLRLNNCQGVYLAFGDENYEDFQVTEHLQQDEESQE